ncbi:MAG: hypothetical protein H6767_09485 [Candidatus Peribacteria bacterium]|nr:MAG: hypothetical protein H6767_09485 [Candidatus Peribacteria bacterium]
MKKNVFFIFLCLLLVLPTFADDVTDVQTRVTQIQTTDPTLPSISEQKGIYGTILSKLFDGNGKIKDIFLQIVGSLSSGNVPRWDGSQLVSGVLTDDGTNVGIGFSGPQAPLDVQLTNGRIHVRDSDVSNGTIPMIGTNSSASTHL